MQEITITKAYELIGARLGSPLPPPDNSRRNANIYYYDTAWGRVMLVDNGANRINWEAYVIGEPSRKVKRSRYMISEDDYTLAGEAIDTDKDVYISYSNVMTANPGLIVTTTALTVYEAERAISSKFYTLYHPFTTLPRAEIIALLVGLTRLKTTPKSVTLGIPNGLFMRNINRMYTWQRLNWRNSRGTKVQNADLWESLIREVTRNKATFTEQLHFLDVQSEAMTMAETRLRDYNQD